LALAKVQIANHIPPDQTQSRGKASMKIGILQTGHVPEELVPEHGEYPTMFEELLSGHGFTFENFPVVENRFPGSVHDADGWLITGSRHGAYEDHDWIPPLEDFIRSAFSAGVPLVGICFGHQIIAQALGGKVIKFPGGWGVGEVVYHMDGGDKKILAMHQDQVIERPEMASVIAHSDFCANAGLAYKGATGDTTALTFQPHPEFSPEYMRDLIESRMGRIPVDQAKAAMAAVGDENDSPEIAQMIAGFFKQAAREQAA